MHLFNEINRTTAIKLCKKCGCKTMRARSGDCKPCAIARMALYRLANAEKIKIASAKYCAENPEKLKASRAKYNAENKDKRNTQRAKSRSENLEREKAYGVLWRAKNFERLKAYNAAWSASNPESRRIHEQNRRALKRDSGGKLSKRLSEQLFQLQRGKCACGCKQPLGDDYHLDHIMPIALGGSNTDDNIQLLRARCNLKKSSKHPVDFMQSRGFLI